MKEIGVGMLLVAFSAICFAQKAPEGCYWGVDGWGFSHHADRRKGYNEKNWGAGARGQCGNWFAAVDDMRNSVRGNTLSVGGGYEYPVFSIGDFTFSAEAELTHLDYEVPGRGVARGFILLPGIEARKGRWGGTLAYVPPGGRRESIFLIFGSYYFY